MTTLQIQSLLTYLGYDPGEVDGLPGKNTRRAVLEFQAQEGLATDGSPGPLTQAALLDAVAKGRFRAEDAPTQDENKAEDQATADGNLAEKYLQSDGCYHIPRGVDVQLTRNFWAHEIHCQGVGCCTESVISKRIMDLAQEIRDDIGGPLEIANAGGSGYRCPVHNAETNGASQNSLHTISDAVDLHYRDPAALKAATLRHLHDGEVGLYSWGCHVGRWDRGYVSQFNG